MDFSRAAKGKVTRLALHYHGNVFRYARISDTPPKAPVPGKPPVLVKLDTNHLDACAGCYEVAPGAVSRTGLKLTVWRRGAELLAQAQDDGRICPLGAFLLFPESEINFLEKFTGDQFRFIKSDQGQVTAVAHHSTGDTPTWFPDWEAKKLK